MEKLRDELRMNVERPTLSTATCRTRSWIIKVSNENKSRRKKGKNNFPLQNRFHEWMNDDEVKKWKRKISICAFCIKVVHQQKIKLFFRLEIQVVNHICARLFSYFVCWHFGTQQLKDFLSCRNYKRCLKHKNSMSKEILSSTRWYPFSVILSVRFYRSKAIFTRWNCSSYHTSFKFFWSNESIAFIPEVAFHAFDVITWWICCIIFSMKFSSFGFIWMWILWFPL